MPQTADRQGKIFLLGLLQRIHNIYHIVLGQRKIRLALDIRKVDLEWKKYEKCEVNLVMSNLFYSKFKVIRDNSIGQVGQEEIIGKFSFFVAYMLTSCSIFLDCLDQELMIMIYSGQNSVKDISCHQP